MGMAFVARAMAWWLRLFFEKRGEPAPSPESAARAVQAQVRTGMYRAVPAGVDREAYRKVQRAAMKMQRKIDAGTMTEAEALRRLGVEL
jgi:hypothetical protein